MTEVSVIDTGDKDTSIAPIEERLGVEALAKVIMNFIVMVLISIIT